MSNIWNSLLNSVDSMVNKSVLGKAMKKPTTTPTAFRGTGSVGNTGYSGGFAGGGGGGGGAGVSVVNSTPAPTPTPVPVKPPAPKPQARVGGASTGGSSSSPALAAPEQAFSLEQEVADQQAKERTLVEQQQQQQREGIAMSFEPIFKELDRQLSTIPTEKLSYEDQLARLADSQLAGIRDSQAQGEQGLERSKALTRDNAQTSLRDLEEDVRNQLKAGAKYLGVRGSADSSATDEMGEAINRDNQKARSGILSAQDRALGEIEAKIADVKNLASQETRKVDEWKSTKLFEMGQFFSERINELNTQKANATAEQQRAITEMIAGLEQDFLGRLRQLDDSVINYKTSIATWEMQRAAEMEDYRTKLGMTAAYNGGADTTAAMKMANDVFNKAINNAFTPDAARQVAINQTGVDPWGGYELSEEEKSTIVKSNTKPSLTDQLAELGALSNANKKPGLLDQLGNLFR